MRLFAGTPWDKPPRCERCGELEPCACPPPPPPKLDPASQTARLALEKRAKGKMVTVVRGLPAEGNDLSELLTKIKTACGAGGTLKEGTLEIQGEHLPRVREVLSKLGFRVKG